MLRKALFFAIGTLVLVIAGSYLTRWPTDPFGTNPLSVTPDQSTVNFAKNPSLIRPGEVELIIKGNDDLVVRALAPRDETNVYFRGALALVEHHRARAMEIIEVETRRAFEDAFADKTAAVDDFADWFFEWGRGWDFLGRSLISAGGAVLSFSPSEMTSVAERDLHAYFRRHYYSRVLKPELRDPKIKAGIRTAFEAAYREYRFVLEESDERLKDFIRTHARFKEVVPTDRAAQLDFDWNSQSFKAPVYRSDDAVKSGAQSVAFLLGGAAAGPAIDAGLSGIMATVAGETLVTTEAATAGGVVGTELFPGVGTVLGAIAGIVADYFINKIWNEGMNRDDFVAETTQGLDATIDGWRSLITKEMRFTADQWFTATKSIMMTPKINDRLTGK